MFIKRRARHWRSIAGLFLGILLVPVLIGISACLDTPIGDPEQGWVDPRVSGVWLGGDPAPAEFAATLWILEPYDKRTWLVTWLSFSDAAAADDTDAGEAGDARPAPDMAALMRVVSSLTDERAEIDETYVFKAWLTSIGDRRFLVLEPKLVLDAGYGFTPQFWLVYHVVLEDERMRLAAVSREAFQLGSAETRAQAEHLILDHLADPLLYEDAQVLYRVPLLTWGTVRKAVGRAGFTDLP